MENNKAKQKAGAPAQAKEERKYTESELQTVYQKLIKEIQMRDMTNMFKRLDYLFEVVKNKECFDAMFVQSCADEIETALTPVEPEADVEEETQE